MMIEKKSQSFQSLNSKSKEKNKREAEILRAERNKEEDAEEREEDTGCSWGMGKLFYCKVKLRRKWLYAQE